MHKTIQKKETEQDQQFFSLQKIMVELSASKVSSKWTTEVTALVALGIGFAAGKWLSGRNPSRGPAKFPTLVSRKQYSPGQKPELPSPAFGEKVHVFDPSNITSAYKLVISTGTPRPIALISSTNRKTGVDNVAPFSYFGIVGHNPPMVAIGFSRNRRGQMKDSITNIEGSKEFAINFISEWYLDAANHTCGDFPPDVDEFIESGLTKAPCEVVKVPRVAESAVTYECQVVHLHTIAKNQPTEIDTSSDNIGDPTTEIVIAKVVRIHVDDTILKKTVTKLSEDGNKVTPTFDPMIPEVDTTLLRPMGRLGGNIYTTLGELVDIPRPTIAR